MGEDEIEDGHSVRSTAKPSKIVTTPKTWDPVYSTKTPTKPIDALKLFFDSEVIELIVSETNRYAQQNNRHDWRDLEKSELEAFLGMLLLMSVNPMYHFYLYLDSDSFFANHEILGVMTLKRFQDILNCLHLSDNTKEKKRGEDGYDKLWKVRPLIEALNQRIVT
ncbi:piggyBac transposable element-derived protein 3-like [Ixodes scapularis]|uniref:piggyBac transposable element-derived protein 3-like n=1 Tax=Ixodes scapularis TaxID=6945 RepID=UPI001A9E0348|nr:piggyBac transposable element-derived protein 3-like [Ixodes scapularis]